MDNNEIKALEDRINNLEYDYVCKRIDVEEFMRQRSILTLKLENLKQREKKKGLKNRPNVNIIYF